MKTQTLRLGAVYPREFGLTRAHLEQARAALSAACQQMSAVRGASAEWEHLGTLYDQVKSAWHQVDAASWTHREINTEGLNLTQAHAEQKDTE
ncbi:MAG: hypothetical protein P8J87_14360 [Verrucomicrobiales bacterium]|nr:hypothetical protein [Verrucomicrobiales bacterium]